MFEIRNLKLLAVYRCRFSSIKNDTNVKYPMDQQGERSMKTFSSSSWRNLHNFTEAAKNDLKTKTLRRNYCHLKEAR